MRLAEAVIRNRTFQFAYILFIVSGIVAWGHGNVSLLLVPALAVAVVGTKELFRQFRQAK